MDSAAKASLTIRPVAEIDEFHACEQLQRDSWSFDSDLDVVPLTQLVAAQKAGGVVLGAFDHANKMRGFCYGFLGLGEDGGLLHYSHMTAVDPELRGGGIGALLKWAQRDAVLAQGIDRMIWTFDPLESLNAYFNFAKLGVVADTYWENLYGDTGSALHRGTPTDRFKVEWRLASERVQRRSRGVGSHVAERLAERPDLYPCVLAAQDGPEGIELPGEPDVESEEQRLVCEIPESIQGIKKVRPQAAIDWRLATRRVMRHYLGAGWKVRECVRTRSEPRRTLYLLDRRDDDGEIP